MPIDLTSIASLAGEILHTHLTNNGSTYSLASGRASGPLWAVSPYPERSLVLKNSISREDIESFILRNLDLLEKPSYHVGTWISPEGHHYLDISVLSPSMEEALSIAAQAQQRAVFNLETGETVYL